MTTLGALEEAARPLTVAERIAEVLREAITRGTLAPGAILRQDELALRFGFSRMPVRDALRLLEPEGIVAIHPTRGATVARLDPVEIGEIFALREVLEVEALRLSSAVIDDDRLDAATRLHDHMEIERDVSRWGLLNRAFHLELYGACGNGRLLGLIEAQHRASDRYVRLLLAGLDHRARSQIEHRAMLDACRRHDGEAAVELLKSHLREGADTLVAAIADGVFGREAPPARRRTNASRRPASS